MSFFRNRRIVIVLFVLLAICAVGYSFISSIGCSRPGVEEESLVIVEGIARAHESLPPYSGPTYITYCGKECDNAFLCGPVEATGNYLNGKRHGEFRHYDVGGNLTKTVVYVNGVPNGK